MFDFHVPASNYRRRPAVRLSSAIAGHPFPLSWFARLVAWVRS